MSIQLKQLFAETAETYALNLVAGKQGLLREIIWVQFCEDSETTDFLRGAELIITTGLCAQHPDWLKNFILALIERDACGLIINTGKYIQEEDITPTIRSLCEKHSFPLFTMPWRIHLADIMQDYYNRLFSSQQNETSLHLQLQEALLDSAKAPAMQQGLVLQGLGEHAFHLCVLEPTVTPLPEENRTHFLLYSKTILNRLHLPYRVFWQQERLLLLLFTAAKEIQQQTAMDLATLFLRQNSKNPPVCGISSLQENALHIATAWQEACVAAAVARLQQKPLLSFDALGIYRLLFAAHNRSLLQKMQQERLQILLDYDEKHHTQLAATLRLYLFCGNSLQDTAQAAFTHRNTINYRMGKIRELLHCNLDDAAVRFEFMLAFYIADYLQIARQ